jgi:hypothetical protein
MIPGTASPANASRFSLRLNAGVPKLPWQRDLLDQEHKHRNRQQAHRRDQHIVAPAGYRSKHVQFQYIQLSPYNGCGTLHFNGAAGRDAFANFVME